MKKNNKTVLSVQLALQFVSEHKEMFEEWVKKKYEKVQKDVGNDN